MLIPDVNVLLGAHREDDPAHAILRDWLTRHLAGGEPVGISDLVLSAVVRIATHPRIYRRPATPEQALEFCDVVRRAPAAVRIIPGARHWETFATIVRGTAARGNAVPDAYLAAFAIDNGAVFVTRDRGIRVIPGLIVVDPLSS